MEKVRKEDEKEREIAKVLTFYIGDQIFGIEIPYVIEIIGVPPITRVPGIPYYIKGIINVRSKVVPLIDLRTRFRKEEIPYNERTCTIIVAVNPVSVSMIVDEVLDVLSVSQMHIAKTPQQQAVNSNKFIDYILEMNDGIKLVLDVNKLMFEDEGFYSYSE